MTCDIGKILRDPVRLDALHGLRLLDTPAEEAFDRLSKLAAAMTATPVALVTLLDFDRQFFRSCFGLPQPWSTWRQTPLSHSLCEHVVATGKPLVIEDARQDPELKENLAIPDRAARADAGVHTLRVAGVRGAGGGRRRRRAARRAAARRHDRPPADRHGHATVGGVTLAQRLREQRPGLRVVFSSGYSSQALSEAGLTDAPVFLPKPYRAADLLGKVREALAR